MATKTNHNAGWKARVRETRRQEAEERQKIYAAKSLQEKLKGAGERQKARILRQENADLLNLEKKGKR